MMSLIKLSYFFLLALFGILACIYFEAELIAIYTWHDHKLFPYSKFYGEMDGFDENVDLLVSGASSIPNSPYNIFNVDIISPALDSIAAFDNMLHWQLNGKALHHQHYKSLNLRHFTRSLVMQIYIDNVLIPIPNNGAIYHESLATMLDFVSNTSYV